MMQKFPDRMNRILRISFFPAGLVLNFGERKVEIKRKIKELK